MPASGAGAVGCAGAARSGTSRSGAPVGPLSVGAAQATGTANPNASNETANRLALFRQPRIGNRMFDLAGWWRHVADREIGHARRDHDQQQDKDGEEKFTHGIARWLGFLSRCRRVGGLTNYPWLMLIWIHGQTAAVYRSGMSVSTRRRMP